MAAMAGSCLTTHLSLEAFVKTYNADNYPFVDAAAYYLEIVACSHVERNGAAFHGRTAPSSGGSSVVITASAPTLRE